MTVTDLAESWDPYLTIGEGLYLAAQAFTRDLDSSHAARSDMTAEQLARQTTG